MKRIIIVLCFLMSTKATTAQTIDTTIKYCVAAKIVPFVYAHDFPVVRDTITHLGIFEYKANDSTWSISYTFIAQNPTRNVLFGWKDFTVYEVLPFYSGDLYSLLEPVKRKFAVIFR
jgi:hypothetical protein